MNNIIKFLCKPFKKSFSFFLSLVICASIADVVAWISYGEPIFALYLGLHGYLMCYIIAVIYNIIRNEKLRKLYALIFILLAVISCLIDVVCHYTLHVGFTKDLVAIIMGTNPAESYEFLDTFITAEVIWSFLFIILLLILIYLGKNTINVIGNKLATFLFCLLFIGGTAIVVKSSENWEGIYLYKIKTFLSYSKPIDLKEYLQDPSVSIVKNGPQNIVLVIGESFTKYHSSLYGYELKTNPCLEKLKQDSLLFVYDNVESAELGTIVSFQCIMSTYKPECKNKWYECVTLPEVISKTDYKSIWISNQSKTGVYDNVVSKYAELCDTSIWIGQKFAGIVKNDLDELVLEKLNERALWDNDKNVFIIHLMGSHYTFRSRYPQDYDVFKPENYMKFKEHQRATLAEYDNSILYNDYVVNEICNKFKDEESVVLYFPDHGLDVYYSDENYVGHPRVVDSLSVIAGRDIPFMIYTSPLYQQNFSSNIQRIKATLSSSFRTDDVLYTIMDIIGVKFANNDDVSKYSLLNIN